MLKCQLYANVRREEGNVLYNRRDHRSTRLTINKGTSIAQFLDAIYQNPIRNVDIEFNAGFLKETRKTTIHILLS